MSEIQRKIEHVKQQAAYQVNMDLVSKMQDRCFTDCVRDPGDHFSTQQRECINNCVDRFREARSLVNHSFNELMEKQKAKGQPIM
mmetsp:Transcript_32955/g.92282  ORF Transcript_32955/g.92282 Transcript_32955/m.92282 type:complete len:85 (-) Transcript_32955:113-367(-)